MADKKKKKAENGEKKKFSLLAVIRNNAFMLGKVAKYTPGYFVGMIAEGVAWGLGSAASSIFTYNLLNSVSDGSSFAKIVPMIGLMAVFYLCMWGFDKWYWHIMNPILRRKLLLRMHEEIFTKARSIELAAFDDPEFYNDFIWAMNESATRAVNVVEDTGKLINRSISSLTIFGLIFTIDPVISIMVLALAVTSIVGNTLGNKRDFEMNEKRNPLHRKKAYINRVFRLSDFAKEIRISNAADLLEKEYDDTVDEIATIAKSYGKKFFLYYGIMWEAAGIFTKFAILVYMIFKLSDGDINIGGFAAAVNAAFSFQWNFVDFIERVTKFPQHSLFIEKYRDFLHYDVKIKGGALSVGAFEKLEMKNVTFAYRNEKNPDAEPVLKNITLTVNKGDKIAIVGYNGAGKTTLIKLLMRLYDPTEGEILYNGVNIKEYDLDEYREMIGTVFQDFKIFALSIGANVMNGEYVEERDREKVLEALRCADFTDKLETLENGLDTVLTREFDEKGTNLSGGESQKIAIARVFAGDHPIVIMDEPSSALDPTAEYNLNKSILENTKDKTVIFISHRLSTTRIADEIYMFDSGDLIEKGSHTELMEKNGKYAEMFRLQSEKYLETV